MVSYASMSDTPETLLTQAFKARRENRLADAKRDLIEAVDLCRESNDKVMLAKALTALGQIERDLHHSDAARQHYEEALALYRADGNMLKLAHTVRHLGDIHRELGNLERAEPCYKEALEIYREHPETSPLELANAIRGFAILKTDIGDTEHAKWLWQEARDLYAIVNVHEGVSESKRHLAQLAGR